MKADRRQFRAQPKRCVYCHEPADTKDHVPPKAILRKPFPQLITVPACTKCNKGWGLVDARFRNLLSLVLGLDAPAAREFWETRVLPGVRQGGPSTKILAYDVSPLTGESGLKILAADHDPMIERLMRGLTYKELRLPLPPNVPIEGHALIDGSGERALEVFRPTDGDGVIHRRVGPDFEYWRGFDASRPFTGYWLFRFFGQHHALGVTGAAAEETLAIERPPRLPVVLHRGRLFRLK